MSSDNPISNSPYEEPLLDYAADSDGSLFIFEREFARAEMVCIVENIFQDGERGMLEWKDPLGLRGCGFFHVTDGKIKFQRGYWDKLSFLRQHHLPLPAE